MSAQRIRQYYRAGHLVARHRNHVFGNAAIEFLSRAVPIDGDPAHVAHLQVPHHEGPPGDVDDVQ